MVGTPQKILAVAFTIGIAATGATLAGGVAGITGNGAVDVTHSPLYINDTLSVTGLDSGETSNVATYTTAKGRDVFEASVSGVTGGEEFSLDIPINNSGDSSLYLVIRTSTSENLEIQDVTNSTGNVVEVKDGVYVVKYGPGATGTVTVNFLVANDAAANAELDFQVSIDFAERSPGQEEDT